MTQKTATKAEKLANAMNDFMSSGRPFTRNLAAQVRDELRRLSDENARLTAERDALRDDRDFWKLRCQDMQSEIDRMIANASR